MALNLADPGAIVAAYESIMDIRNTNNWLLLQYSKFDELALFDHGSGGLRELKRSIEDPEQVHIGFYREEVDVEPGFVVINYIPPSIPAVKKVKDLDHLTPEDVRRALSQEEEPDSPSTISTFNTTITRTPPKTSSHQRPYTADSPLNKNKDLPDLSKARGFVIEPVRRVVSEAQPPPPPPSLPNTAQAMTKSASMFSSLIRGRKKKPDFVDDGDGDEGYPRNGPPPPAPPKDKKFTAVQPSNEFSSRKALVPLRGPAPGTNSNYPYEVAHRTRTVSEFAVVSHASSSNLHGYGQPDEFGYAQQHHNQYQNMYLGQNGQSYDEPAVHVLSVPSNLRGKWGSEPLDAAERLRRRQEELRQRQEEEAAARQEEERLKEVRRLRKEQELRELEEAEAKRRASIEEEVQALAYERQRRERLEKEEEERRRLEIEERKRVDRERRMEEHRRLEEWRKEQTRMAEESARRADEARRKEEVERKKKIQVAEAKVKKNHNVDSLISGWVSMQTDDSLLWKRRFYKFIGTAAYFYRNPKDTQQYLDKIELRGTIHGLREWNEGYEDLAAIPHSFAIEFKDKRGHWSMFSDSEEEKYKLLGLLHYAAGL
ncbi:hypothetical protein H0H92_010704 [Tricholoma furcatifolium]|nr:hypothetical protein H0H92_010704 [Tricholoma furcatifolium]